MDNKSVRKAETRKTSKTNDLNSAKIEDCRQNPVKIKKADLRKTSHSSDVDPKSPPAVGHVPCKFFRNGACQAGNLCPFSHEMVPSTEASMCQYFLKGNCKFGSKCMLAHGLVPSRGNKLRHSKQFQRINLVAKEPAQSVLHNSLLQNAKAEQLFNPICPVPPVDADNTNLTVDGLQPPFSSSMILASSLPSRTDNSQRDARLYANNPFEPRDKTSTSYPAHTNTLWGNPPTITSTHFAFEEDFVPGSLEELLTPFERRRKAQHESAQLFSYSPSRSQFSDLFERRKREDMIVGSPLRNSYSNASSLAISPVGKNKLSPALRSRSASGSSFMAGIPESVLSQSSSNDRSDLQHSAVWVPRSMDVPALEEETTFFMEDEELDIKGLRI